MTDMHTEATTDLSWDLIWSWLDKEDKEKAIAIYADALTSNDIPAKFRHVIYERLASELHFREKTIRQFPALKLQPYLSIYLPKMLRSAGWDDLILRFQNVHDKEMLDAFFQILGVSPDKEDDIPDSSPTTVHEAIIQLQQRFPIHAIRRMLASILLRSPELEVMRPEFERVHALITAPATAEANVAPDGTSEARRALLPPDLPSDEFKTLDRVLINQIMGSVQEIEGALRPDELVDMIEHAISLNASWHRVYYHLGLMDGLLSDREPDFDRPEFNETRREWYLAGLMAALVRKDDGEGLDSLLKDRSVEFRRAAERHGGPGATMAKNAFKFLLAKRQLSEALLLLRGQFAALQLRIGEPALDCAREALRARDISTAQALLNELEQQLWSVDDGVQDDEDARVFEREVRRRLGQVRLAQGDFKGARELFADLLGDDETADVLADVGLAEGKFRWLDEVMVPEDDDHRENILHNLQSGEASFLKAITVDPNRATNAHYAMATLDYLRFRTANGGQCGEQYRDRGLTYAQAAAQAMRSSRWAASYEQYGLLGQALFIQTVLLMNRMDHGDARAAIAAWRTITADAGKFPKADVQHLLHDALVVDASFAREIAESILRYRGHDAFDILAEPALLAESKVIQDGVLSVAKDHARAPEFRWRQWSALVPVLLRNQEIDAARDALDEMQVLAGDSRFAASFIRWLGDSRNYEPAWDDEAVSWARFWVLRKLGRDADAAEVMKGLYYRVRDSDGWLASEIISTLDECVISRELYADIRQLHLASVGDDVESKTAESALIRGEPASIYFIGGNEVQQAYDEEVRRQVRAKWPAVSITFEHTGWSANWGRDLDRLIRHANQSDAVVMMTMMRTRLGESLRSALKRPRVTCTGRGQAAMIRSIKHAAVVGTRLKSRSRPNAG